MKAFILSHVKKINVEDLVKYILDGTVTFEELRKSGNFPRAKQDAVKDILEEKEVEQQKQIIINDIKYNPRDYTKCRIENLLNDGKITKEDLYENDIITEKGLEVFLNPPYDVFDFAFEDRSNEPLKPNHTDIYFLGNVGSGKSCLLGGLLYYTHRIGCLHLKGSVNDTKYANGLIQRTKMGYVPPATLIERMYNFETTLTNEKNVEYAFNLIDMSGEYLRSSFHYGTISNSLTDDNVPIRTLGYSNFIHNDNKKQFFFVLGYQETINSYRNNSIRKSAQLEFILSSLDNDGVLAKTESIYIILAKSDLLPNGADDLAGAKAFIEEEYKAFWNNVKRCGKKHGFNVQLISFSLGKFMLGGTFEYNPKYSENIYDAIMASSTPIKKKRFNWFKIKKNTKQNTKSNFNENIMKDFILSQVRRISVEDLVKYILDGTVTFEELRKSGNFPRAKQDAVRRILEGKT